MGASAVGGGDGRAGDLVARARVQLRAGRASEALATLGPLLAGTPPPPVVRLATAALRRDGRWSAAIELVEAATAAGGRLPAAILDDHRLLADALGALDPSDAAAERVDPTAVASAIRAGRLRRLPDGEARHVVEHVERTEGLVAAGAVLRTLRAATGGDAALRRLDAALSLARLDAPAALEALEGVGDAEDAALTDLRARVGALERLVRAGGDDVAAATAILAACASSVGGDRSGVAVVGRLSPGWIGARGQLGRLASLLASAVRPVHVLLLDHPEVDDDGMDAVRAAGATVHRVRADPGSRAATGAPRDLQLLLGEGAELLALAELLDELRPEVVHAFGPHRHAAAVGTIARGCAPRRTVLHLRAESPPDLAAGSGARLRTRDLEPTRALLAALARCDDVRLLANSDGALRSTERWLGGLPPTAAVVGNVIDADELARQATAPVAPPWPTSAPVVLGAFRMVPVKRPLLWLDIARGVHEARPDVHVALCGDGPLLDRVRSAAAGDAWLHVLGHERSIAPWLATASTLLHVSASEGSPNVVLEAQALGVPVVVADVGGCGAAVDDGRTGIVVAPDADVAHWVRAVLTSLDPVWRDGVAARATARVRCDHDPGSILRAVLAHHGGPEAGTTIPHRTGS